MKQETMTSTFQCMQEDQNKMTKENEVITGSESLQTVNDFLHILNKDGVSVLFLICSSPIDNKESMRYVSLAAEFIVAPCKPLQSAT